MQIKIENINENNINEVYSISCEQFGKESWTLPQFEDCLKNKNYICYVAIKDNKITSFLIAQDLIDSLNLLLIATKKEFKNNGFASILMNELLGTAENKKVKVWLEVKETNIPAIQLYEKLSFTKLYERKNYYKDNSSAIIMEKV